MSAASEVVMAREKAKEGKGQDKEAGTNKKASIANIYMSAMQAGKCIRCITAGCDNKDCQWPHECSVCEKKGCAAWKHPELMGE